MKIFSSCQKGNPQLPKGPWEMIFRQMPSVPQLFLNPFFEPAHMVKAINSFGKIRGTVSPSLPIFRNRPFSGTKFFSKKTRHLRHFRDQVHTIINGNGYYYIFYKKCCFTRSIIKHCRGSLFSCQIIE